MIEKLYRIKDDDLFQTVITLLPLGLDSKSGRL